MTRQKPLATIDCETDPFKAGRTPLPFIWDIFDGVEHNTFHKTDDALDFLEDKNWLVYGHNGGKYDYHMPGFLDRIADFSSLSIINGRIAKFFIGDCEFRDSYNILPIPLADFKKDEIDYEKMEPDCRWKHMDEITRYLHGDTEYLYELISRFHVEYGRGLTLAGSAMKYWSNKYNRKPPQSSPSFYNTIKDFYYGGRCQVFRRGNIGPCRMDDINSAYPRAMLDRHPIEPKYFQRSFQIGEEFVGHNFYRVRAKSNGALPVRKSDGGIEFPESTDYFNATGWEIIAGLETNTLIVESVIDVFAFDQTISFAGYIDHFYEMKKRSKKNTPEYIFAKLFMNSLYGKFAANPEEYGNYEVIPPQFVDGFIAANGGGIAGEINGRPIMRTDLEETQQRYYNVATGASITGWVRAHLWRSICDVRKSGGEVIYCDTDSIVHTGPETALKHSKELGDWSTDGIFSGGAVAGKKLYAFRQTDGAWKTAHKGVKLSPHQIISVANGATEIYESIAPTFSINNKITPAEMAGVGVAKNRFVRREVRAT